MKPTISVVLPCYKVEKYIDDIFSDLRQQTFSDFEMIFVSDGGGQSLEKRISSFNELDTRVKLLRQSNQGVSVARNNGIEHALGDWILFVDPDDRLSPDYINSLYNSVKGTNAEFGVGGYVKYYVNERKEIPFYAESDITDCPISECYLKFPPMGVPWNKIYKKAILMKYNIRFRQGVTFMEDDLFNNEYYLHIDRASVIRDCGYRYIMADASSAASRYHSGMKETIKIVDGQKRLLEQKWGIKRSEGEGVAIVMYMVAINIFKKGNTFSFQQQVKYIREEILGDKDWMMSFSKHDRSKDSSLVKLSCYIFDLKNPVLIAFVFKFLFLLKYNFYGIFIKAKKTLIK